MKFCNFHWDELRGQVISKGMGGLIVEDSNIPLALVLPEVLVGAVYDPLMAAQWSIVGMALETGGFYLLSTRPGDGGEYCPLCEVEDAGVREGKAGLSLAWMEGCTDAILVHCREQGLLPRPQ